MVLSYYGVKTPNLLYLHYKNGGHFYAAAEYARSRGFKAGTYIEATQRELAQYVNKLDTPIIVAHGYLFTDETHALVVERVGLFTIRCVDPANLFFPRVTYTKIGFWLKWRRCNNEMLVIER